MHYLPRDIRFKNRILQAYVGGDGATLPSYAGKGVFSLGLSLLYREVKRRNGAIVYGYNTESIYADFYRKRFGEIAVYRPRVLIKILDLEKLVSSILPAANRIIGRRLPIVKNKPITIRLALDNQNPIDICLTSNGTKLSKSMRAPDIIIKTQLKVLSDALPNVRLLVMAFILRRINLKISGPSVPKLLELMLWSMKKRR